MVSRLIPKILESSTEKYSHITPKIPKALKTITAERGFARDPQKVPLKVSWFSQTYVPKCPKAPSDILKNLFSNNSKSPKKSPNVLLTKDSTQIAKPLAKFLNVPQKRFPKTKFPKRGSLKILTSLKSHKTQNGVLKVLNIKQNVQKPSNH